jgi:hypothetical protein
VENTMKSLRLITIASLFAVRYLVAQDSTQAPAPAAPAPATTAASIAVSEAVLARTVASLEPQDSASVFPADVGQVVCWTRVTGGSGAEIHDVWFHGDTQVGDVALQIGGSPWRTWSRKTVPADWTGPWHVEVRDASGAVLKRLDFTIGQ